MVADNLGSRSQGMKTPDVVTCCEIFEFLQSGNHRIHAWSQSLSSSDAILLWHFKYHGEVRRTSSIDEFSGESEWATIILEYMSYMNSTAKQVALLSVWRKAKDSYGLARH
jgi:hypothetical protein